jgi:hypothetical protein
MKKVLFPLFVSLFILAGCGPEEPETPPKEYELDAAFTPNEGSDCIGTVTVVCLTEGTGCQNQGTATQANFDRCSMKQSTDINLENFPNSKKIQALIESQKFEDIFLDKQWRKMLPSLANNTRLVELIKHMKLDARLLNPDYLLVFNRGETLDFNNLKKNCVAFIRINNYIPN